VGTIGPAPPPPRRGFAIRGCTACAGDGAVAGGGADFGGFEAFFYGCELGFETVRCLLAMFDVVWGDGRKRTDGWLA
jgi:hypothetical protein